MIIHNMLQQSPEWFELRCGKITGTGLKEPEETLVNRIISEIDTNRMKEIPLSKAMQWGLEYEDEARRYYEGLNGSVKEVGFCQSDIMEYCGFSPDGLLPNGGALEIKCPDSHTHVDYIRNQTFLKTYKHQILMPFVTCDSIEFLDFVSYDPRSKRKPYYEYRILRQDLEKDIIKMRDKCASAWKKIEKGLDLMEEL